MDYEKKQRLIALRNRMKEYGYTDGVEELESIFPQLAESKDEEMIKWLIDEMRIHYDFESPSLNPMVEKVLAWLEKQNEQEPEKLDGKAMILTVDESYAKGYRDGKMDAQKELEINVEDYRLRDTWEYIDEFIKKFGRVPKDIDELSACVDYVIKHKTIDEKEQKPVKYISDSAWQKVKRAITDCKKLSEHYEDTEENFHQYYGGKAEGLRLALDYFGNENELPGQKPINQCNTHEPTLGEARKWNEAYEKGYSLGYENGRNEQKLTEIDEYEIIKKHITESSISSEVNKRLTECGWYVTERNVLPNYVSEQKPVEYSNEEEYLDSELRAFLCNYDKEYDDDPAVSDVAKHFYEIGKRRLRQEWSDETKQECGSIDVSSSIKTSRIKTLENLLSYLKYERKTTQEEINTSFIPCLENLLKDAENMNDHVEWNNATINGEPIPTENQSVDISLANWSEEDDSNVESILFWLKSVLNKGCYPEYEHWLKSLPERFNLQPKQEWNEKDYREEDIQTRFAFYTYKDDPSVLYLSNVFVEGASRNHGFGTRILKAAEKVAEAIGAITISLKVKQDSPANAWYRKNGYGYVAFEDGYDWLEKNLEYLKPIKWNEDYARIMEAIEGTIKVYGKTQGSCLAGYDMDTLIVHLKNAFTCLENQKTLFNSGAGLYYYNNGKATYMGNPSNVNNPYDFAMSHQETQKEQKSIISAEESLGISQEEYNKIVDECIWGEQKEQEPTERNKATINGESVPTENQSVDISLPKWSEEGEKIRQSIIKDIEWERNYTSATIGNVIGKYDEQIAWLKSLPLNLKKKNEDIAKLCSNEWSEEDAKVLDDIVVFVSGYADKRVVSRWTEFLKSLRPQPHTVSIKNANKFGELEYERGVKDGLNHQWKPSDEQMEAFRSYLKDFQDKAESAVGGWNNFDVMIRLYEQLKKLT